MKLDIEKFIKSGLLLGLMLHGCIDLAVVCRAENPFVSFGGAVALICWMYWVRFVLTKGQ